MINVPKDVKKYLVQDEVIDNQFRLKNQSVFTSINRMFIKTGNTVRDISYAHISSLQLLEKRKWLVTVIGFLVIVATFCIRQFDPPSWANISPFSRLMYGYGDGWGGGWAYYILGVILIISGYIWKSSSIKCSVAGISGELVLSGSKNRIDVLFQTLNERRFKNSDEKPMNSQSTKNIRENIEAEQ